MTDTANPLPGCFAIVVMGLCALALVLTPGCAASLTPAQRVAYADEERRCDVEQAAVRDREGTTLAEDEAALMAIRADCDAHLHAIEAGNEE
jgi:hypothetical protein